MKYIACYLPYFAFAAIVFGGMHYHRNWVIAVGLLAFLWYDPKPELKLLTKNENKEGETK